MFAVLAWQRQGSLVMGTSPTCLHRPVLALCGACWAWTPTPLRTRCCVSCSWTRTSPSLSSTTHCSISLFVPLEGDSFRPAPRWSRKSSLFCTSSPSEHMVDWLKRCRSFFTSFDGWNKFGERFVSQSYHCIDPASFEYRIFGA